MMGLHKKDHPEVVDGCFGCKIMGLQLSPGDAAGDKAMSSKKWNGELNAYQSAREQGIQPGGTTMNKIRAAHIASENLGRAYDGGTMPPAHTVNKRVAQTMNEVGV